MATHAYRFIVFTCMLAAVDLHAAEFFMPEPLRGTSAWPVLSPDGQTLVVGDSNTLVKWSIPEGVADIIDAGDLLPNGVGSIRPKDIAADGTTVGYLMLPGDRLRDGKAFRWTETGGIESLDPQGQYEDSRANGVSADGSVIVGWGGHSIDGSATSLTQLIWNNSTSPTDLGGFDGFEWSQAMDVSDDGKVIVGESMTRADPLSPRYAVGWVWTAQDGFVATDSPLGLNETNASLVSGDGSVVAGWGIFGGAYGSFRWTKEDGLERLESSSRFLDDRGPQAISQDGSVVLGSYGKSDTEVLYRSYVWDEQNEMRDLEAVLRDEFGLDVPANDGFYASGVSDNLQTLIGSLREIGQTQNRLWIATLDRPLVGVPEPSAITLVGLALICVGHPRKRRTKLLPASKSSRPSRVM